MAEPETRRMPPGLPRVWIITDPDHPEGPVAPLRRALESCAPNEVGVQLRAKHVSDRVLVRWGQELRELTRGSGSLLAVNRRWDVAQIVDADVVHLPERGLPIGQARSVFPSISSVGVSRHDRPGLEQAAKDGASYAFLSPVFTVPGKSSPIGVFGFRDAIAGVGLPTYALGGVDAADVRPLMLAGAAGVAVCRAIYEADQPDDALSAFLAELDKKEDKGE